MRTPNQFFRHELPAIGAAFVLALGVAAVTRGDGEKSPIALVTPTTTPALPKSPVPDGFYHHRNAFASDMKYRSVIENGVLVTFYEDKDGLEVTREFCDAGLGTSVDSDGDIYEGTIFSRMDGTDVCADDEFTEDDGWSQTIDLYETATVIDPLIDEDEYEGMEEFYYYEEVLGYKFDYDSLP